MSMDNVHPPHKPSRFLTINEACSYVRVSRSRLYELLSEGRIVARKLGHRTLVPREELDRFLDALPEAVHRPMIDTNSRGS